MTNPVKHYVYLIEGPGYFYSFGHATNVTAYIKTLRKDLLRDGSTSSMNRQVKLMWCVQTTTASAAIQLLALLERQHHHRRDHGRWFALSDAEVANLRETRFDGVRFSMPKDQLRRDGVYSPKRDAYKAKRRGQARVKKQAQRSKFKSEVLGTRKASPRTSY